MTSTNPLANDLAGAVDLASPLQLLIRKFGTTMSQGIACILVGQLPDGQLVIMGSSPGGNIHISGMLSHALVRVGLPSTQQPVAPPVPEVDEDYEAARDAWLNEQPRAEDGPPPPGVE